MSTRSIVGSIARQQRSWTSFTGTSTYYKAIYATQVRHISYSYQHQQKLESGPSSANNGNVDETFGPPPATNGEVDRLVDEYAESISARKRRTKTEAKTSRLEDRKERIKEQKQKLAERDRKRRNLEAQLSAEQVTRWERNMEHTLGGTSTETSQRRNNPLSGLTNRVNRAAKLAQTVDAARYKQPSSVPGDSQRRRIVSTNTLIPGSGTGALPTKLSFEETEIVYPPKEIYPPPTPLVHEVNLIAAARAFGIIRGCEVEWDSKVEGKGSWRKTNRTIEWYEARGLIENLDNERGLEYLGDACLHLLSRSLLMTQYPGKTVSAYNAASSWLVSNECFAYMFEDSGLEDERLVVANLMMEESKKRELLEQSHHLTEEERKFRENNPVPEPVISIASHIRKADLLEAYVGAVYLIFGFPTAAKWCTPLLAPWLDLIGRTKEFNQDRYLSPAGEAVKRRAEEEEEAEKRAEEAAREQSRSWWSRTASRVLSTFYPTKEPPSPSGASQNERRG